MVITSMNMYEFSEKTNREMGVLIDAVKDTELFQKAANETSSIIMNSEIISLKKTERIYYEEPVSANSKSPKKNVPKMGYCIRCEARLQFNPLKPYCADCFVVWAQFENRLYVENVCHSCGEFVESSMERPLCYKCYRQVS
jgi:hypothetical protein